MYKNNCAQVLIVFAVSHVTCDGIDSLADAERLGANAAPDHA